jgi:hypothetical protein
MKSHLITNRFLLITGMVLAAAFVRLIPHPPNFAPITAIALFGGAYFTKKWAAFLIPLTAMFVTDFFLGFHETMWAVYLSFVLIVLIGMYMIKEKKIGNIFFASVISSVSFFVITNFGAWVSSSYYEKNITGLVASYTAAIPFFHYTLLGDLFFVAIMFGLYEIIRSKIPGLVRSKI